MYITSGPIRDGTLSTLFDPQTSVLKHLTVLHLHVRPSYSDLAALAQSPLLSNLTSLKLHGPNHPLAQSSVEIRQQSIQQFINSPFLWGPQLKHLELMGMMSPNYFLFDHLIPVLDAANVQLETLNLDGTYSSLHALSTASCISSLKRFEMPLSHRPLNQPMDEDEKRNSIDTILKLPFLSTLEVFPFTRLFSFCLITIPDLIEMLTSPSVFNNLIELDLGAYHDPMDEDEMDEDEMDEDGINQAETNQAETNQAETNEEGMDEEGLRMNDVVEILCNQRVIPGDQTSPLKFGKLQTLKISVFNVDSIEPIVNNLKQLTNLCLACTIPVPPTKPLSIFSRQNVLILFTPIHPSPICSLLDLLILN